MKKIIGCILIVIPFIVIFSVGVGFIGLKGICIVYGMTVLIVGSIGIGVYLLDPSNF